MIIVCILCFIVVIIILLLLFIKPKESYIDWDDYKNVKKNWIDNLFDETYVITIPKRKNYVNKIMKTMKIKPVVFKAFEQDKLDRNQLIEKNIIEKDSKIANGRIACHLSHVEVLKSFLNNSKSKTCFIFEDDVKLPDNLTTRINKIKKIMKAIPSDWDLINFGRCWDICSNTEIINEDIVKSFPLCRHAYAVTRKGAQIIIDNTFPMKTAGDAMYRQLALDKKLNIYTSLHRIFDQNREKMGSELDNNDNLSECHKFNIKDEKVSVIILSYNRPHNLETLLPGLNEIDVIDEIIVAHGLPEYTVISDLSKVIDVNDYENQKKYFALRKFMLASKCKNNTILILDDDLLASQDYIHKLIKIYNNDRLNLYGGYKRVCSKDGYHTDKQDYNSILTGYCLTSKKVIVSVLEEILKSPYLKRILENKGNGDDLIFNYYFKKIFNKTPIFVDDKNITHLDESNGYSSKPNHYKVREQLCKDLYQN